MSDSPTVFIIDPSQSYRVKVAKIAEEMRIPYMQFSSAEAFLQAHSGNQPGCLVTEFRLLGMSGIELQEILSSESLALPLIFVTAYAETNFTVRAMKNGAITVLEKPFSEQELWDSIHKAISQNNTMRRVDAKHTELRRRLARLTQKERRVLDLMVEGKTNKAIAGKLDISVRTVEARRHQIFKKTNTDSVAELVRVILQSGIGE